jgi:GR25 family glycosyltransferase involved in LPS biosynthesis
MNYQLIKLFNPDLKKLNNIQLTIYFKNKGFTEDRIFSIESFFKKYPYFNDKMYKLYNTDITITDKIELMVHWHLKGIHEKRICSDQHFEILHPEFNDKLYNNDKSAYHQDKFSTLNLPLNPNEETILIIIDNSKNTNFILKSLSLLNHHYMNKIIITQDQSIVNNIFCNTFIVYNEKYEIFFSISNYLISDNDDIPNINKFKKIYLHNSLINSNSSKFQDTNNILFIDNNFDNFFIDNSLIISEYDYYSINNNKLYDVDKNIDTNTIINKLYLDTNLLDNYVYINDKKNIRIINLFNENDINTFQYGIIQYKEEYYFNINNNYTLCNYNYLLNNLPNNIEYIYIENLNSNSTLAINNKSFFKINVIFIVDETNIDYFQYNLNLLLDQDYSNFNIIIFYNGISKSNFKSNKIFVFENTKKIENIKILLFLIKLADNDSLITIIDSKYLLNPLISLSYINLLFLSRKLLLTDFYSNGTLNIITFKKELIYMFENNLSEIISIYNNQYLDILYFILKNITKNNNYLKKRDNIFFKLGGDKYMNYQEYFYKNECILNEYLARHLDNFSNKKMITLFKKDEIILDDNDNVIFSNKQNINTNETYLDLLLYLYRKNKINYYYYQNKLELKMNTNPNLSNKLYQIIIFLKDIPNNINNQLEELYNNNLNIQINIIHFGNKPINLITSINYIFLNNTTINTNINTNTNKLLGYNLMVDILKKYNFQFEYLIFYNLSSNIFKLTFNEKNENVFVVKKSIYDNIGGFDPEIFNNNSNDGIYFFIEKMKKLESAYIKNENAPFIEKLLYMNIHNDIFFYFLRNKNNINYNICNKIKSVVINLEDRKDRLKDFLTESNKINLYNFDIFNAIKINSENYNLYSKLLNKNKAWKKQNDYIYSALGCKASHLEVLKKYKDINEEYLMIIEDDCIFEDNFIIYLNLALLSIKNIQFDILYLAVNLKNKSDATKISSNLLKINSGLTTTAQIFKKSNIDKIIHLIENSDVEIDNTYNTLMEKYCVYPMCVYQKESFSDINKKVLDYGKFHKKYIY